MSSSDAAALLGVPLDVSEKDLNRRIRQLARECHPDLYPGDKKKAAMFKKLNEAYTILSELMEGSRRAMELEEEALANEFEHWINVIFGDGEKAQEIRSKANEFDRANARGEEDPPVPSGKPDRKPKDDPEGDG